jgi:hypothetical protein
MRFIMMHKADKNSEADVPPSPELVVSMGKLMEEMAKAGVLLAGEGLQPSSKGVRLKFSGGKRTVTRGPFTGSNELIAGFAIVRVESMEMAIEWASRLANVVGDVEIDIGLLKEPWDLGLCPKPDGQMTRFMMMYKADESSEAGVSPTSEVMEKWTQDMVEAGVLLSAQALQPSSKGARLKFAGGKRTVRDGPFTESKELIGGFCMLQVKLKEEAIEWGSRFAKTLRDARVEGDLEIDICPVS